MILSDLAVVCEDLRRAGIEYIVVGGASLERKYSIGTADIDVVVALRVYPDAVRTLRRHPRVRHVEDLGTMAVCEWLVGTHWTDVELINPKLFCGTRPPDEFIDYVRRFRSEATDLGRVANPEVVWYMRLAIDDWTVYVQKILRDVRAGVPPSLLEKVLDITDRFGNREVLEARVRKTREMIDLADR